VQIWCPGRWQYELVEPAFLAEDRLRLALVATAEPPPLNLPR
jgi:hypothetical protein